LVGAQSACSVFARQRAYGVFRQGPNHDSIAKIDDHDAIGMPSGPSFGWDRHLSVR
jgi:hypothetical protein